MRVDEARLRLLKAGARQCCWRITCNRFRPTLKRRADSTKPGKLDQTTHPSYTVLGSVAYGGAAILAARTGLWPVPPKLPVRHCANFVWFDLGSQMAAAVFVGRALSLNSGREGTKVEVTRSIA